MKIQCSMIVSLHKNFALPQLLSHMECARPSHCSVWNKHSPNHKPVFHIWDYDWGMHNTFGNDCGVNILRECNTKLKGLRKLPLVKVHRYKIRVESAFLDL